MTATFPLDPLATAAGIVLGQIGGQQAADGTPGGIAELALRIGVSASTVKRRRVTGLSWDEADDWAGALGYLPNEVWGPRWYDDLEGVGLPPAAAVNAAKTACPRGHAYDAVDGRGRRCCRTCWRDRQAAHRARSAEESANPQLAQVVTATQPTLWDAA